MSSRRCLRVATRGSTLALRQAAVLEQVLSNHRYDVEIVPISTTGDEIRDELIHELGKTGAFVRDLDEEVLAGNVDCAVHSLKDVPTDLPDDIVIAGVPKRGEAADVLVTPSGSEFEALPAGAVIGTASQRRKSQLLHARSELVVKPIRGNVDTRIEKLLAPWVQQEREDREENPEEYDAGVEEWEESLAPLARGALDRAVEVEYDGIVLARVGLVRGEFLGDVECVTLPEPAFIPAPGQGALAVTAGRGSDIASMIRQSVDHPLSRVETTVERIILDEIGGGCIAPIGIHATVRGENVHVAVAVFDQEGQDRVGGTRELPIREYGEAARQFGEALCEEGAAKLVAEARAADTGGSVSRADE